MALLNHLADILTNHEEHFHLFPRFSTGNSFNFILMLSGVLDEANCQGIFQLDMRGQDCPR
jgi:hypothetical protein